jgi:hypothetical protein
VAVLLPVPKCAFLASYHTGSYFSGF